MGHRWSRWRSREDAPGLPIGTTTGLLSRFGWLTVFFDKRNVFRVHDHHHHHHHYFTRTTAHCHDFGLDLVWSILHTTMSQLPINNVYIYVIYYMHAYIISARVRAAEGEKHDLHHRPRRCIGIHALHIYFIYYVKTKSFFRY